MENFTYRNADKIIVISQDFKRNIMEKGVPDEKIEVIYNWIDSNSVQPIEREQNFLFEEFGLDRDRFYVVYAGNLGAAQNIDIIIESALSTLGNKYIMYLLFGKEDQLGHFREIVEKNNLSNMKLFPIQPLERVSYVYSLGDVSIVSCKAGFGSIGMPSKFATIMSSGRAVLASFDKDTELQNIIESHRVGLFTPAGDATAFKEAILYLSEHPELCKEYGRNGRQFILENLTKEVSTQKYVDLIRSFEK